MAIAGEDHRRAAIPVQSRAIPEVRTVRSAPDVRELGLLRRGGVASEPVGSVDVQLPPRDNCVMMLRPTLHLHKAAGSPLGSGFYCFPPASPAFVSEAGKQKTTPKDRTDSLICLKKFGAGEGIRTLDPDLGKIRNLPALGTPCLAALDCGSDGMGGGNRTHTPDRRGH